MIVYGWNNYCLKTVTSKEVNISEDDTLNAKIQYRIKYFHVFWIPVFPLGTYWTLNMNGKQMELTQEMKAALNTADKSNLRWIFSWSGILLPLLIFGGMQLQDQMERRRYSAQLDEAKVTLDTYFKDKASHQALIDRVDAVANLCDSILGYHLESDADVSADIGGIISTMDTSEAAMLMQYLETIRTQPNKLEGINESNSIVITKGHDYTEGVSMLPQGVVAKAIKSGVWEGSDDTASVFSQIRRIENTQFMAMVREENWAPPIINETSFNSGYWYGSVIVYDLLNKKEFTRFKILAMNSDKVSYYAEKDGQISLGSLDADLRSNVHKIVNEVLFNKKERSESDTTAVSE